MTLNRTLLLGMTTTLTVEENITKDTVQDSVPVHMCDFSAVNALYEPIHGYLAVTVCTLGTIFNIMNILVLTHKDMRSNPINLLLTGIAVADMMVMVEYIPFAFHMYLFQGKYRSMEEKFSYNWGMFLLFHVNFSIILHTVSIWYTLVLAVWRFIMIKFHTMAVTHCTRGRCSVLLVLGYVLPIILTVPNFMAMSVKGTTTVSSKGTNQTLYSITWSPLAESNNRLLYKLNVWFYSFFLKLVPCTLLSIITCLLIRALYMFSSLEDRKRSRNMDSKRMKQITIRKIRTDRTTRLLIVILCLFLISEFPQGILGVLSGMLGNEFFISCYTPLGEMMDMMALTNCMVNFILYCTMSRQFRITFKKIFGLKKQFLCLKKNCSVNTQSPIDDLLENYFMMPIMMTQATNRSTVQDCNKHDQVRWEKNTLQDLARSEMCSAQDLVRCERNTMQNLGRSETCSMQDLVRCGRNTLQDLVRCERNTMQDLARSEMCSMQDVTKYRNTRTRWSIEQPLPRQVSRLSL